MGVERFGIAKVGVFGEFSKFFGAKLSKLTKLTHFAPQPFPVSLIDYTYGKENPGGAWLGLTYMQRGTLYSESWMFYIWCL